MPVFSYLRANQLRGFLYFWKNADFYKNGLSSNFVAFQCCRKFCSVQQEKPHVKESFLVKFNENIDLPKNKFEKRLLDVLKGIGLNNRNPSSDLVEVVGRLNRKHYSDSEIENVKKQPFFNKLCLELEKNFVVCTPQELYTNFKFALFFNFPDSSLFVQKLLVLILDKINLMSHFQLMYMLLYIQPYKGKNAESLKKAISVCLEYKQPMESMSLATVTFFFAKNIFPESTRKWMLNIIAENNEVDWIPSNWENVLQGIISYNVKDETTAVVVDKIRHHLVFYLNSNWPTKSLLNICYSIFKIFLYNCKSERLIDVLAYYLSQKNLSLCDTCKILCCLLVNNHFNCSLYEKFCKEVQNKMFLEELVGSSKKFNFETLVVFSKTNFLGLDEETVANLKKYFRSITWLDIHRENSLEYVSKVLLYLLSIDIYNKNFADMFNDLLIKDIDQISAMPTKARYVFLLYHYLSVFHPEDKASLPDDLVEKVKKLEMDILHSPDLKNEMERVFGGEKYVISKCFTPEGIFFDYAVALTSDNTPLDLSHMQSSGDPVTIDPNTFPKDAKLVFIGTLKNLTFLRFSNVPMESVWKRISDKMYQKLNYNAVLLSFKKFGTSLENELFIKKAISDQLGKIHIGQNQ